MATLAKRIDMSESISTIQTITSLSPIQFQKLRLEEAKRMLSLRRIDISEVAFLVGYESPSHFSRVCSHVWHASKSVSQILKHSYAHFGRIRYLIKNLSTAISIVFL